MTILVFSQLVALKHLIRSTNSTFNFLKRVTDYPNNVYLYCTGSSKNNPTYKSSFVVNTINQSESMKSYLERAKAYDEYMKKEIEDFNIGKRNLAHMMGADPATFDQNYIDDAIRYLFPSGLYDKKARPVMKHPKEIIPPKKAAQFDSSGRPLHSLFYTTFPNYYQMLYDIVEHIENLNKIEDENIIQSLNKIESENIVQNLNKIEGENIIENLNNTEDMTLLEEETPVEDNKLNLLSSDWISYDTFKKSILEDITAEQYEYFISSLQALAEHPYAYTLKNYIYEFRKNKKAISESMGIIKLEMTKTGRPYVTIRKCMRKEARGEVTVLGEGTGKIEINDLPLTTYFPNFHDCVQKCVP